MCYLLPMLDFHCHFPSEFSIVCTDNADVAPGNCLMSCCGLLPDKWSLERMSTLLETISGSSDIQLGEVGLDRRFESVLDMKLQQEVLKALLEEGARGGKCISLHSVRATERMLFLLSELPFRPHSILWHGYTGSLETARELCKLGVLISVGPRCRLPLKDLYSANPNLVLETDYTGTNAAEHADLLRNMYNRLSQELGWDIEQTKAHIRTQYSLFHN